MTQTHHAPTHARESGFTVVIIAALFIAFAVIAAAAVERNTIVRQITMRDSARDQLSKLSIAIIEYSVFHRSSSTNLYPCPAQLNLVTTNALFGASVDTVSGYTQDCSSTTNDGNPTSGYTTGGYLQILSTDVIRGMVPVTNLSAYGITNEDAFDPWGNRIMYIVNRTQTTGGSPNQGNNPTITDKRTNYAIAKPDFILVSYGRDAVGAIKRNSTSVGIACTAGTTDPRFENCDDDSTFFLSPTYIAAGASTAAAYSATSYFDDILTWYRQ